MRCKLTITGRSFAVRGAFVIARGTRSRAEVVEVHLDDGQARGRGECVPYPRYGETVGGVMETIEGLRDTLEEGLTREELREQLPAGAARNAVDCALWDLECKRAGRRIWELRDLSEPEPVTTAFTISLGTPEEMRAAARAAAGRPLMKLKFGGAGDVERARAVREAAPNTRLIADANESWSMNDYRAFVPALAALGVKAIEQPFPAGEDGALAGLDRPIPVVADESCHDRASLAGLAGRYDMINIKLDKAGGLTEALALKHAAREAGFGIMIGCMLGSSLAMAPALLLAGDADLVDLDGPLLLAEDRANPLTFDGSTVLPPPAALWG